VGGGQLRDTSAVTDAELIESSLVDGASFALVFDRHYRALHRFLRGRVGSPLADDLASETFTTAFRRRASYDLSRDDARPWLYGIAVKLMRNYRRSEERRLHAYTRAADAVQPFAVYEEPLDETVASAVLGLSVQDRNLILLYAWAGLSYEQLAEALELPLGTVRSRLSRVRSKLQAILDPVCISEGGEPA
jgi:RNA polymerase sigma factor (sigma-70 family)